jgi:hypothetical protein
MLHGRIEVISTFLTAVMFVVCEGWNGDVRKEALALAVGFGLILQTTAIMLCDMLNLQTPK